MALGTLPPLSIAGAISQFLGLIDRHRLAFPDLTLDALTNDLIAAAGLEEHYRKENDGKGQDRIENLGQLVEIAERFRHELGDGEVEGEQEALAAFLAHAALESGDTQADEFEDSVQLMTLHSAKGLEFPSSSWSASRRASSPIVCRPTTRIDWKRSAASAMSA
jgi:DNA helicase-2/ATP-dependent DNA helicase PcrA